MSAAAERACEYVMRRIISDGQVAYLMGPFTEGYNLLTEAVAEMRGKTVAEYRAEIEQHIKPEAIVPRWMLEDAQRPVRHCDDCGYSTTEADVTICPDQLCRGHVG